MRVSDDHLSLCVASILFDDDPTCLPNTHGYHQKKKFISIVVATIFVGANAAGLQSFAGKVVKIDVGLRVSLP